MKQLVLIVGSVYGFLSIILGALGSHALKKILSPDKLHSFDIGVKYMMYHAIVLLVLGFFMDFSTGIEKNVARLLMLGTFLFSVSIYFLAFSEKITLPTKFIGPITPVGGMLMIVGWGLLIVYFIKYFKA